MSSLPTRRKLTGIFFRRTNPDQILVVQREAKGARRVVLPFEEMGASETPKDAARRLASHLIGGTPLAELDLGPGASYRVKEGPSAGEWAERFYAIEFAPDARAIEGVWLPHYDAKGEAGADAPRVREAITRLREVARLKP